MPYVGFVISYKKVAQCFSFQIQNNSIQLVVSEESEGKSI